MLKHLYHFSLIDTWVHPFHTILSCLATTVIPWQAFLQPMSPPPGYPALTRSVVLFGRSYNDYRSPAHYLISPLMSAWPQNCQCHQSRDPGWLLNCSGLGSQLWIRTMLTHALHLTDLNPPHPRWPVFAPPWSPKMIAITIRPLTMHCLASWRTIWICHIFHREYKL